MGKASRKKTGFPSQGVLERGKNAIQTAFGPKEFRVRTDLPQQEKISNALSVLLKSEVARGSPLVEYRAALSFIIIAWNISLLPADGRAKAINEVIAAIDGKDEAIPGEAIGHINRLIARKHDLFPNDQRFIVSWDVRFKRDTVHITAATFAPSP